MNRINLPFMERRFGKDEVWSVPSASAHPLTFKRLTFEGEWINKTTPEDAGPFVDTYINRRNNGVIGEVTTSVVPPPQCVQTTAVSSNGMIMWTVAVLPAAFTRDSTASLGADSTAPYSGLASAVPRPFLNMPSSGS